jgi:RND family efflux transporter MFP subunit
MVKQGQPLAELTAPEMKAQVAEAESRLAAAEAERLQAAAQLEAARSTFERLTKAAQTPGSIAGNELTIAQKQMEAAEALVHSKEQAKGSAAAAVAGLKDLENYLIITAPFEGVVTERTIHPGALVGPGPDPVLFVVQQISRLRLLVPVPEVNLGKMHPGKQVSFHVPSDPQRAYSGAIARVSHSLDPKTRTMAVELDVWNRDGSLAPGMFPTVKWPVAEQRSALLVPKTSVVTTTERTFVILNNGGRAQWRNVSKGAADGDQIEVAGDIRPGDQVVKRATDEIRDGSPLEVERIKGH